MASREETLLFLVDVQVKNAGALRRLDADLDAAVANGQRRLSVLQDAANGNGVAGRTLIAGNGVGNGGPAPTPGRGELWGVRGPIRPGSRENPVTQAQESGESAGLGGLAAATGAPSADKGPLPVQVQEPSVAKSLPAQQRTIEQMFSELRGQRMQTNPTPGDVLFTHMLEEMRAAVPRPGGAEPTRDVVPAYAAPQPSYEQAPLSTLEAAKLLGTSRSGVYSALASGALSGQKVGGQWQIDKATVDQLVLAGPGGAGGGGGEGGPPVAVGGGGGGGADRNRLLRALLWGGGGALGIGAGMGSLASFAGLGPEHLLMTGLGLAGSAGSALGGAGLLGLGALGTAGVGIGTDAAGLGQAANDIKAVVQAQNALTQAVAVYGKNSTQAKTAQAQLNATLNSFSPIAHNAVLAAANTAQGFHQAFNAATGAAEKTGAEIINQAMQVGEKFLPTIGKYAAQNMGILKTGLQPLFAWLGGPTGMGILDNLESNFQHNLPTAIHAFDQGMELFLRVTSLASNYTGGLTRTLDGLFTRLNSKSDFQLNVEIGKLIDDFRIWEQFVKYLILDIYALFHNDANTGQGIIQTLTVMLQKLHEWETSTTGSSQLHTIFEVHKQEVIELLQLLPPLISGFSHIYLAIAPEATLAFTALLSVVVGLLKAIDSLGPAAQTLLGLALVGAKLGILGTALAGIGTALGIISARAPAAAAGLAAVDAAAAGSEVAGGAAALEGAGGAAAGGSLLSRLRPSAMGGSLAEKAAGTGVATKLGLSAESLAPLLTKLLAGGGGLLAGSAIQHAAGLRGGTGGTLGFGIAGGALGSVFGPWGTAAGAAIGSTFGPTIGHLLSGLFGGNSGEDYGKKFAKGFTAPFSDLIPKQSRAGVQKSVADAANAYQQAQKSYQAQLSAQFNRTAPSALPMKLPAISDKGVLAAAAKDGKAAAAAYVAGWSNTPFPSEPEFVKGAIASLNKVPPQARKAAATAMVAAAQQLQASGKLPVGSVKDMIHQIERQFPGLTVALTGWAHLTQPQQALAKALETVRQDFHILTIDKDVNGQNLYQNLHSAVSAINSDLKSKFLSAQTRQEMEAALHDLQSKANAAFNGLLANAESDMSKLKGRVTSDSAAAQIAGDSSFQKLAAGVGTYMGQGYGATNNALNAIVTDTNKLLKQIGQKPLQPIQAEATATAALISGTAGNAAKKVGGFAVGGKVTQPMYMVGEEAPTHPEIVLASNPAYRQRNRKLWAEAGRMLDVPGFAQGGRTDSIPGFTTGGVFGPTAAGGAPGGYVYPFPSGTTLERVDEGQDASMPVGSPIGAIGPAKVMGQIPNWFREQPLVWEQLIAGPDAGKYVYLAEQITSIASGILSAHQALARFAGSGTGIEMGWAGPSGEPLAHGTYTEGQVTSQGTDFANFLQGLARGVITGGAVGSAGGGGATWKGIAAPHITGGGLVASGLQGLLNRITKNVNTYGQKLAGSAGAVGVGSVGGTGSVTAANLSAIAKGLGYNWDAGEIQDWLHVIAAESGGNPLAQNPKSTAFGIGQFLDSTWGSYGTSAKTSDPHLQLVDMAKYIHGKYVTPAAAWASEQSIHSYAQGGILGDAPGGLPMFRSGGAGVGAKPKGTGKKVPAGWHHKQHKPAHKPKHNKGVHGYSGGASITGGGRGGEWFGKDGPLPFYSNLDPISDLLNGVFALDGGQGGTLGGTGTGTSDADKMSQLITWYTNLWSSGLYPAPNFSSWQSPSDFVITTDPKTGQTVTPYISTNINQVVTELGQMIGWQSEWVGDLNGALGDSNKLVPEIQQAIKRRADEVQKIRDKVAANIAKIKALQKRIKAWQARKPPYAHPSTAAQRTANANFAKQRHDEIQACNDQISALEKENQVLVGGKDAIPSTPGGELGQLQAQLGSPAGTGAIALGEGTAGSASGLYTLLSNVQGWASQLGGVGGDIDTQQLQLSLYQQGLSGLLPGANTALTAAMLAGTPTAQNPLTGTTAFSYQGQTYIAGLAEGGMMDFSRMSGLPEFAGVFHGGGVVPGPAGQERMALVQAGERITPADGGAQTGELAAEMRALREAICDHASVTRQNTDATRQNTTAAAKVSFTRGSSPSLSSESALNLNSSF